MSDAPELLACPFCGGAAEAISLFRPPHRGNTFVKCKACGAAGRRGGYGWAISNWNIRADLPASVAARLRAADELEEAITNEREMVCQDMDMQAQVSKRLEEAITAYRATKEIPE